MDIKNLKKQSLKSEKKKSKSLGSKLTKASGAGKQKGDHILPHFLVEQKDTVNESFSLHVDTFLKILREASAINKSPALNINFNTRHGSNEVYVITREDFDYLQECYRKDLG